MGDEQGVVELKSDELADNVIIQIQYNRESHTIEFHPNTLVHSYFVKKSGHIKFSPHLPQND